MEFFVNVDVRDVLPGITGNFQYPVRDFEKLPAASGDLLLYAREGICHRTGECFVPHQMEREHIVMKFDDFVPGMSLHDQPPWYEFLKERILSTKAVASYGAGQGLKVAEDLSYMYANARIRNVKMPNANEIAYVVKISAEGPSSLSNARTLHGLILRGEY
jgi:hypothetical protein